MKKLRKLIWRKCKAPRSRQKLLSVNLRLQRVITPECLAQILTNSLASKVKKITNMMKTTEEEVEAAEVAAEAEVAEVAEEAKEKVDKEKVLKDKVDKEGASKH